MCPALELTTRFGGACRFGNRVSTFEGQPAIEITAEGPGPVSTQVLEIGNGDAVVHYQCSASGNYHLSLRLAGSDELIGGAACEFRVTSDVVSFGSCQVCLQPI